MPAFIGQTVLRRDILTPPVRQRDETFSFGDKSRMVAVYAYRRRDEPARQWQFRNTAP